MAKRSLYTMCIHDVRHTYILLMQQTQYFCVLFFLRYIRLFRLENIKIYLEVRSSLSYIKDYNNMFEIQLKDW